MTVQVKPADIFLTRGHSFISKAIRFFSTTIGEKRTKVNHVGVIISEGTLEECIVIEALSRVKKHRLCEQYGPPKKDEIAIFRPTNLTEEEINIIIKEANKQVGRSYGYWKIVTHFLDWFLLGAYVFRRLTQNGNYPICSWLVAHAFSKANKHFDVNPGAAEPDDIWDFVTLHKDKYEEIYPLKRLGKTKS